MAVGIVVAIVFVADGGYPENGPPTPTSTQSATAAKEADPDGADGDVQIHSCEVDSIMGWAKADLTITNRSSQASNYLIEVEFVDGAGRRLDKGVAAADNLAPGQAAQQTAQGFEQVIGKITCRVLKVTRHAS
ncbi:hypothetical protein [Streptomyces sp. NPDC057686]|uniref:hypothetical protein n=1 Tax=Streptomyces TaxID=1883 RepID=UPI00368AD226